MKNLDGTIVKYQGSVQLTIHTIYHTSTTEKIPFFASRISAGFPSPADDHVDRKLDLNELIIKHPAATFFVRVEGRSMEGERIHDGDILVVDRSRDAKDGDIIIAVINGDFAIKRLRNVETQKGQKKGVKFVLESANPKYDPIEVTDAMEFQVWGVVTYTIHKN